MTMTDNRFVSEDGAVTDTTLGPIPGYAENPTDAPPPVVQVPDRRVRIPCPECGKEISRNNMAHHRLRQHDVGRKRDYKPRVSSKGKTVTKPKTKAVAVSPIFPADDVVKDDPLTVDGIVATVVELRWPHTMPTRKALEMLEIRSALEKFLA